MGGEVVLGWCATTDPGRVFSYWGRFYINWGKSAIGWVGGEENQSEVGGKTPEVNVLPRDITDKTDFFIGNSVNLAIY